MILTIALISIVICIIAAYIWSINNRYDYFKRLGISGPPHHFFFGHYKILWSIKSLSKQLQEWTRQYGSIYGLFMGTTPMYVVSDVDFLQEVYIKQFSSFHSRIIARALRTESPGRVNLFRSIGARWRRQRHVLNPTFSSAKLKLMSPLVNRSIGAMLNKISQITNNEHKEINIYDLYQRLTMDVICRCAFGIDTDMQNDINNPYLQKSAAILKIDVDELLFIRLSNLMPILARPLHDIFFGMAHIRNKLVELIPFMSNYLKESPDVWLLNRVQDVVDLRMKSSANLKNRVDLLQLMMDATTNDKVIDHADDHLTPKVLRSDELLPNIFLFMVAGYETTSTALAYSTYVLATKPEIQDKLIEEINHNNGNNNNDIEEDYEIANNLSYLDFFVREVLRMYPITVKAMTRECNTTTVVCGHKVEKGSIIQPDILSIHYNPDLWGPEDPNLFIPERHAVKRHPIAWMPFGVGPRNCIGMRFALMELKMCLIQLLRQYRILPGDNIEEGFKRQEKLVIQPAAIFVKLEKHSPPST
ncbi:unnamed protein product [Rotaria sp. Silwood2]|nr:unnamed protein product [Rotaria sp. Silwood2]CAF2559955.1 unnamed protein product [Rotaria sp. Silwood2]CAF2982471.1 unnamed protein product [Rotaria sp. Silwood2]CAF3988457.1 unnamed protein product [Rotaria sp. Silwood2]CAF4178322.1 unnamed protein product [Rotaria sp. Silwood2]